MLSQMLLVAIGSGTAQYCTVLRYTVRCTVYINASCFPDFVFSVTDLVVEYSIIEAIGSDRLVSRPATMGGTFSWETTSEKSHAATGRASNREASQRLVAPPQEPRARRTALPAIEVPTPTPPTPQPPVPAPPTQQSPPVELRVQFEHVSGRDGHVTATAAEEIVTGVPEAQRRAPPDWRLVRTDRGVEGLVPADSLAEVDDKPEASAAYRNVSQSAAELQLLLPNIPVGTYIIRPREERANSYAICVLDSGLETGQLLVKHYLLDLDLVRNEYQCNGFHSRSFLVSVLQNTVRVHEFVQCSYSDFCCRPA